MTPEQVEALKKEYYNKGIDTSVETIMAVALCDAVKVDDGIRIALIKLAQAMKKNKIA
jgi:hypothetical protein